jgi:hypothetical protein
VKLKTSNDASQNPYVANQQVMANRADGSSMLLTLMIREFAETLMKLAANENSLTDPALTSGYAMLDRIIEELKGEIGYLELVRRAVAHNLLEEFSSVSSPSF